MASLITAPVRLAVGFPTAVTNSIISVFKNDIESGERSTDEALMKVEDYTLFDLTKPNLDLCTLIYYYTELRSSTKLRLRKFADSKNLTYTFGSTPSDIELLYNAFLDLNEVRANLETAQSPSMAISDYRASLKGLDDLRLRFKLTPGDIQVLEQYFEILTRKPKYNTDIKKDLRLYSDYLDPQFLLAFGGKEFNVDTIEDLVKIDESAYFYKIDDDFVTTSLSISTAFKNLGAELVYAIVISDKLKTISVVFRGSSNVQDWIQNLDLNSTECLFPGFTTARGMQEIKQTSFGRVHAGFYDYLFGETQSGRTGTTKSKGEEIMGILSSLLKGDKKGYRVCFTGHSLGGALSTLMAARCAAFNELDTTVYNVSVASPFVGDQQFRDSFYKMEQAKNIMHLRLSNYEDAVPLIPACTYPLPEFHTYKHTGWNIRLFNKSLIHPYYTKSYPKKGDVVNEVANALNTNLLNGFNINIFNHLTAEYHQRLDAAEDVLKEFTLSDLYNSSDWTGWEYDDKDDKPKVSSIQPKKGGIKIEKKMEEPEVSVEK